MCRAAFDIAGVRDIRPGLIGGDFEEIMMMEIARIKALLIASLSSCAIEKAPKLDAWGLLTFLKNYLVTSKTKLTLEGPKDAQGTTLEKLTPGLA
jgi:hypothetical protein